MSLETDRSGRLNRSASPAPGGYRRRSTNVWLARFDIKASPYLYVAPFFVLFGVFGLFPIGYTVWVSLHDWHIIGDREFVGLANYATLVSDGRFWRSVVNTLGMFVVATVPQLLIALWLANLLNRRMRARTLFRMGVLVPYITSIAAMAIVFSQLYARDYGLTNWALGAVGVDPVDWRAQRWSAWLAVASMVDWRWIGYNALIYLAGMQAIPKDLYESAAIDGASTGRQFWTITVPMLRPTIIFTVILSTIGGLQLFTEPVMFDSGGMTGGSLRQFQTVTMYMYEQAFTHFQYGYGSAVAWVTFLLILMVAVLNFLFIRRIGSVK